jgi:hypothetical protein
MYPKLPYIPLLEGDLHLAAEIIQNHYVRGVHAAVQGC